MDAPSLIDETSYVYIFNKLKGCHSYRVNVYYYVLNIGILLLFSSVLFFILYYRYNNKLTNYEKQQNLMANQQMVLSKIKQFQSDNVNRKENELSYITDLPLTPAHKW